MGSEMCIRDSGYCGAQVFSAKFKCLGKCWQVFGGLSDGRSKRLVSVCVLPWKVRGPLPRVGFKGIWASGLPPAGPTLRRARLRCRARGIPANHAAARQSPPATYGRDRSWVGLARRLQKVRQVLRHGRPCFLQWTGLLRHARMRRTLLLADAVGSRKRCVVLFPKLTTQTDTGLKIKLLWRD